MTGTWPLAVSTGCCRHAHFEAVVDALAAAGARFVEIGTPPEHLDWRDPQEPARVSRVLAASGLVPVSVHAPFGATLDLADPRAHHRASGIAAAAAAARMIAHAPGAVVVAHPSDMERNGLDVPARLGDALASLLAIDEICRDAGLRLAVETPLPHLLGGHPGEFKWLLDRLPSGVGVCLDTGHTHLGRHLETMAALACGRLSHVHVHDNRGTADDHLPPGDGTIDWAASFDAFRRCGYHGAMVLELACDVPSADYFTRALASTRALYAARSPGRLTAAPGGHDEDAHY